MQTRIALLGLLFQVALPLRRCLGLFLGTQLQSLHPLVRRGIFIRYVQCCKTRLEKTVMNSELEHGTRRLCRSRPLTLDNCHDVVRVKLAAKQIPHIPLSSGHRLARHDVVVVDPRDTAVGSGSMPRQIGMVYLPLIEFGVSSNDGLPTTAPCRSRASGNPSRCLPKHIALEPRYPDYRWFPDVVCGHSRGVWD